MRGFGVVSSQMLLGSTILCKDTLTWFGATKKKRSGALKGPFKGLLDAPNGLKWAKMTKI